MYQIGDQVIYGMHGVCKIVDVEERMIDRKQLSYLVLEPVGQDGSRYLVPTHNAVAMGKIRSMLTKAELQMLLESDRVHLNGWIQDENQRKQTYKELIGSGDRTRLLQMVHTLYIHRWEQAASGKKCHLCDENFLRDAEKLLAGEISVVMGVSFDQAKQYLRNKLSD